MIKGIDVASYQSESYGTAGLDFVVVKATEGVGYKNPKYAAQVAHGRAAGLVVGHYHFVSSSASMDAQAAFFVSTASEKPGEFLVLDWESPGVNGAEKDEFIRKTKALAPGIKVGLYCNKDYWKNRDHTSYAGDFLWIADPDSPAGHPNVVHPWLIHQYGSPGGMDLDVANFATRETMREWAGSKPPVASGGTAIPSRPKPHPVPAPKPVPKPTPHYAAFPGTSFFRLGRNHPLITAMGKRLVAEGYKGYKVGPGPKFSRADMAAYSWWQKKLGYSGTTADGIPGKLTWVGPQGSHRSDRRSVWRLRSRTSP